MRQSGWTLEKSAEPKDSPDATHQQPQTEATKSLKPEMTKGIDDNEKRQHEQTQTRSEQRNADESHHRSKDDGSPCDRPKRSHNSLLFMIVGHDMLTNLTRHKISDRETGATLAARSGWMANTQSTHLALSRGSLHRRLVRPIRSELEVRLIKWALLVPRPRLILWKFEC